MRTILDHFPEGSTNSSRSTDGYFSDDRPITKNPETLSDQYSHAHEHGLVRDLAQEMIALRGLKVYYLPKSYASRDTVLGEGVGIFDEAIPMVMLLGNVDDFLGDGDLLSQFGFYETRNSLELWTPVYDWGEFLNDSTKDIIIREDGEQVSTLTVPDRPIEDDLIFIPLFDDGFFSINNVIDDAVFMPMGTRVTYKIFCEKWKFDYEDVNVSVPDDHSDLVTDEVTDDLARINEVDDEYDNIGQNETGDKLDEVDGLDELIDDSETRRY